MLACVCCISLEAAGKDDSEENEMNDTLGVSPAAAGALAILCGLGGAVMMSTKHMFVRIYRSNYSGLDQGIDSSLFEFFIMSFLLIPLSDHLTIGW